MEPTLIVQNITGRKLPLIYMMRSFLNLYKRYPFYMLLAAIVGMGCDPSKTDPVVEYDYYPLRLNSPLVYKVTETRYAAGNTAPTVTNWLEKDEAIRRSESSDGFPVFVFARSRRATTSDAWQKVKEYTITQYPDKYLLSIDNVTTVPMVFPIWASTKWNLNEFNTNEKEDAKYEFIGEARSVGELQFSKTLQVSGRDVTNDPIVRYNLGYSQYAFGIGPIYDEQTDFEYCQEAQCFGQQQIASGVSTIRQLVAHEAL
jgi:hypothetical protein